MDAETMTKVRADVEDIGAISPRTRVWHPEFMRLVGYCRTLFAEVGTANAELVDLQSRYAALEGERDALRAALQPFADVVKNLQPYQGADDHEGTIADCPLWKFTRCWQGDTGPKVSDCLRAAELLAALKPDTED